MQSVLLFLLNSIALGVGLAMDAFCVCLANAMIEPEMTRSRQARIAGVYSAFQLAMPLAGWIIVRTLVEAFGVLTKIVPWIALGLLLMIGIRMLAEAAGGGEEKQVTRLTPGVLLVQGIATSIDAISAGLTMASYDWKLAVTAAAIIGLVTFVICMAGLTVGRIIGTKWSKRAGFVGGIVLILIGIEIFVTGFVLSI